MEIFVKEWQRKLYDIITVPYQYHEIDEFVNNLVEATKIKFNNLCPYSSDESVCLKNNITEKIFDELESDAYNIDSHTYNYKITNQIVRRHFEKLIVPKIAEEIDQTITQAKQSQKRIVIEGNEGYSDGYWTMTIYDLLGNEEFKHTVADQENKKDYTFAEFLNEAIQKYNVDADKALPLG